MPDPSNHSHSLIKLFNSSSPEGNSGGNDKHNTHPPTHHHHHHHHSVPLLSLPHTQHTYTITNTNTHTKTHTDNRIRTQTHTHTHMKMYMHVYMSMYMFMYLYLFMKCLKQLHAARKNIVEGHKLRTADIKNSVHSTAQHSTAHDSTSQRNPPLLLSIVCACHRASKKKKPKLIQTGKSLWPFSRNSGVFCRIPVIFTEIGGRNKKRRSVIILAAMVLKIPPQPLALYPDNSFFLPFDVSPFRVSVWHPSLFERGSMFNICQYSFVSFPFWSTEVHQLQPNRQRP